MVVLHHLLQPGYGYDMPFQPPTTLTNRDQTPAALAAAIPYTGEYLPHVNVDKRVTETSTRVTRVWHGP